MVEETPKPTSKSSRSSSAKGSKTSGASGSSARRSNASNSSKANAKNKTDRASYYADMIEPFKKTEMKSMTTLDRIAKEASN